MARVLRNKIGPALIPRYPIRVHVTRIWLKRTRVGAVRQRTTTLFLFDGVAEAEPLAFALLELARINYAYHLGGQTARRSKSFDGADDLHAVHDPSEDDVGLVKPRCACSGSHDHKLRIVRAGARIGHGERSAEVLQFEGFVLEEMPIDRTPPEAVLHGNVAALDTESRYNAKQLRISVTNAVFLGAERPEIFCSARDYIRPQFIDNTAKFNTIALNIHEHNWILIKAESRWRLCELQI